MVENICSPGKKSFFDFAVIFFDLTLLEIFFPSYIKPDLIITV